MGVDADVDDNGRVLEFFGLEQDQCPQVRIIQMGDSMSKFKPESDHLTADSFNSFIKGVEGGSIKKHLMSEEEPEDNTKPVFYVTGTNYAALMAQTDKHILIEFYAPWCGHCKAIEPTWEKLAGTSRTPTMSSLPKLTPPPTSSTISTSRASPPSNSGPRARIASKSITTVAAILTQ